MIYMYVCGDENGSVYEAKGYLVRDYMKNYIKVSNKKNNNSK